jgi:TolB-like protein/class 3 adenylate cyclase
MPVRTVERKLTAILAADVAGYSRLMGADEVGTLQRLTACRVIVDGLITAHRGRIFNTAGDSVVADFASAVDAVECAVAIQEALAAENVNQPAPTQMQFRIGVHIGDVIIQGDNLLGDGVNIAARLETLAEPGGICVSGAVHDQIGTKVPVSFVELADPQMKNIAQPVRAYRLEGKATVTDTVTVASPLALPDKPSIAVLPFANMSGDPEQEYFAFGMVEEIITALSRIRWLFVIARNSTFTYKGQAVDVKQVGRELGVRYLLEGSVRKGGSRVRITAQLIQAETGGHIWAERYDRDLSDIFAIQDEITERVAAAVEPQLYAAEYERSERKRPERLDAWECVVQAIACIARRTRDSLEEAEALCRRAIEIAPGYSQAHSLLAWALVLRRYRSGQLRSPLTEAAAEVRTALAIDERDTWAYLAQGFLQFHRQDHPAAEAAYRRALEFNPNSALAHAALGHALAGQGFSEAAIASAEYAIRLSPGDALIGGQASHVIVFARFAAGQYADSIAAARAMLERYPEYLPAHYVLIAALATIGEAGAAADAVAVALRLKPDLSMKWFQENMPWVGEIGTRLTAGWRRAGVPEH